MKRIALGDGQFSTVDDEDFGWLSAWTWQVVEVHGRTYAGRYEDGELVLMHEEIVRHAWERAERN